MIQLKHMLASFGASALPTVALPSERAMKHSLLLTQAELIQSKNADLLKEKAC